jgi:hypothetical protein
MKQPTDIDPLPSIYFIYSHILAGFGVESGLGSYKGKIAENQRWHNFCGQAAARIRRGRPAPDEESNFSKQLNEDKGLWKKED